MNRLLGLIALPFALLITTPNRSNADWGSPQCCHAYTWFQCRALHCWGWLHTDGPLYNYGPYDTSGPGYLPMFVPNPWCGSYIPAYPSSYYFNGGNAGYGGSAGNAPMPGGNMPGCAAVPSQPAAGLAASTTPASRPAPAVSPFQQVLDGGAFRQLAYSFDAEDESSGLMLVQAVLPPLTDSPPPKLAAPGTTPTPAPGGPALPAPEKIASPSGAGPSGIATYIPSTNPVPGWSGMGGGPVIAPGGLAVDFSGAGPAGIGNYTAAGQYGGYPEDPGSYNNFLAPGTPAAYAGYNMAYVGGYPYSGYNGYYNADYHTPSPYPVQDVGHPCGPYYNGTYYHFARAYGSFVNPYYNNNLVQHRYASDYYERMFGFPGEWKPGVNYLKPFLQQFYEGMPPAYLQGSGLQVTPTPPPTMSKMDR